MRAQLPQYLSMHLVSVDLIIAIQCNYTHPPHPLRYLNPSYVNVPLYVRLLSSDSSGKSKAYDLRRPTIAVTGDDRQR